MADGGRGRLHKCIATFTFKVCALLSTAVACAITVTRSHSRRIGLM